MSGGQGYYQPGLVRMRPKTEVSRHSVIQRYSGDFDLLTRTAARENNNNAARTSQFSNTNMFRRAKSSEWDRDVLNNNISDLRSAKNYSEQCSVVLVMLPTQALLCHRDTALYQGLYDEKKNFHVPLHAPYSFVVVILTLYEDGGDRGTLDR